MIAQYMYEEFQKRGVPVTLISEEDFKTFNAKKVLDEVLAK